MTLRSTTRPVPLDEMVDGRGGLRPHWRGLISTFSAFGEDGLQTRARRLDRAFEEEGATSLLPGESPGGQSWRCDPIPLLIPESEFLELESGLAQRARLLEAILQDLYGQQTLLSQGILPPALVYPAPFYLRASAGESGFPRLQFYAADLIRGPDGAWRVLADRCNSPGGLGYARENRRLLTQVLPEAFRAVQVRQLRPFFDFWQDALRHMAPIDSSGAGKANPMVGLLTSGTSNPQWFEHMYLARDLGCALLEGGDLTVRGGALFLKTLKGLQQVDVLLRRLDGRMLDPLELDPASLLGIPGVMEAIRAGSVRVVNDPGSGLAEAPGLAAYMPALATHLLDERLRIAGIPTMWLGEERALGLVQGDPERWIIRQAADGTGEAVRLAALEPPERALWLKKIAARPRDWVASADIPASFAPCLVDSKMEPRPLVLRVFMASDGKDWRAMPGGLARITEPHAGMSGLLPAGGLAKDVWILSEDRHDIVGPAVLAVPPLRLRRTTGELPSRIADNLFWLGRYVERLETRARLVRAAVARLARGVAAMPHELAELRVLGRCLHAAEVIPDEAAGNSGISTMATALLLSVRDTGAIGGGFADVARLTERVRDRLTGDMYATFTQTLRTARADAAKVGRSLDDLTHAMISIMRFSTAVSGVAAESMVRGGGWLFLELGRRIERAQSVASEVAFALDQDQRRIEVGLRLALELCDSAITYRNRYLDVLQPAPVLDLVLADPGNPRGLAFQLTQTHALLDDLAEEGATREMLAAAAAGLLLEVETMVESVLADPDQAVAATQLPSPLHRVADGVQTLSARITRRYFALLPAVQTLGLGETQELQGAA